MVAETDKANKAIVEQGEKMTALAQSRKILNEKIDLKESQKLL